MNRLIAFLTATVLALGAYSYSMAQLGPGSGGAGQQLNYTHITTTTTTVVKTGSGILHTLCINNPNSTGTITIDDAASATTPTIGVITMSATSIGCFVYDVVFSTGLTVVTASAAGDLTVSWH